jgi:hypothetical protein
VRTKTCSANHADGSLPRAVEQLPSSQGGKLRHVCAGCAYELGRRDGALAEERLRERVRQLETELAKARYLGGAA